MLEMMQEEGIWREDTRTELKMSERMEVMHKGIMRGYMDALSRITAALAANDMSGAAKIAKDDLGWNESQEKISLAVDVLVEKEFVFLGKAMHIKADDLAAAASAGDRDRALAELSGLIKNCNACHEKFRHAAACRIDNKIY